MAEENCSSSSQSDEEPNALKAAATMAEEKYSSSSPSDEEPNALNAVLKHKLEYYSSPSDEDRNALHCCCKYKVVSKESLVALQKESIERVMEILCINKESHAWILLIHYNWDLQMLTAVFEEKGKKNLFLEAGVGSEFVHANHDDPSVMCSVCLEAVASEDVSMMDCEHLFCNQCLTQYFISKIEEGQSKHITCMAEGCSIKCDLDTVKNLVSLRNLELAEKFYQSLLSSFIEDNRLVKYCPSAPHCGNAILVENNEYCEVICSCGLQFCFRCLGKPHSPCSCEFWQLWSGKSPDEEWKAAHTRTCPSCRRVVERHGGCNYVYCKCKKTFCWICGRLAGINPTTNRFAHRCGRYRRPRTDVAFDELDRYLHYYSHFKSHVDSSKLESKLWTTLQKKVASLELKDPIKDYKWALEGLHQLFSSRRAVTFSYPIVFFVEKDLIDEDSVKKLHLFEDQQQQLVLNVERLSRYLDEPFDEYPKQNIEQLRFHVINLTFVTHSQCRKMYESIEELLSTSSQTIIAPYQREIIMAAYREDEGHEGLVQ